MDYSFVACSFVCLSDVTLDKLIVITSIKRFSVSGIEYIWFCCVPQWVITLMTKLAYYETGVKASKWYIISYKQINSD
jgi:hypothetical protein